MFNALLAPIQSTFLAFGKWGVFVLAILQEVFPPIPSTAVTMTAGFVFLEGAPYTIDSFIKLFLYVGLPIASGLTLGAIVIYGIVYWGGKPILEAYGKYIGVSWTDIEKMQSYMKGHVWDDVLMFAARAFPLMPSVVINVFAGLVRWRPLSFVLHTFFGTIIRSMWTGFIGWEFANLYLKYASVIEGFQNVIFVVVAVIVVSYLYIRRKKKKAVESPAEEEIQLH